MKNLKEELAEMGIFIGLGLVFIALGTYIWWPFFIIGVSIIVLWFIYKGVF